jgi:hypothetical protein
MTEETRSRRRKRWPLWLLLALLLFLLAVVMVPPMVSLNRYKSRIAGLISGSLGRPVRLSSVELRLLPRPGFVLNDLTVEEDPAYGAEPVLHASTVTASIRLLTIWRGLEIESISVDQASLNLVRTPAGRWNVESLFGIAAQPQADGRRGKRKAPFPYLEATSSRINVKSGVEKLPFSIVDADLSFWQEEPGEWRIRLRGQPARTDLNLDLADTGVVRLEADVYRAAELRQMPVHLDFEWREAQLGQLTRMMVGSDPGWRGDLTGELHMDGTPDDARIKTRLSASNVHRAEFAPAETLDFDANCSFVYHYSSRAVNDLACNSPLGDGRVSFAGDLPGNGENPRFSLALERFPVAAALDALRTVRSGFGPGLEVKGTVSGKIAYAKNPAEPKKSRAMRGRVRAANPGLPAPGPLTGGFTVQGLELSGNGLSQPIRLTKVALEPVVSGIGPQADGFQGLSATASFAAGAATPLTITSRLALSGYQVTVRGQASVGHLRELAHVAGFDDGATLGSLTGDAVAADLSMDGPWLKPEQIPVEVAAASRSVTADFGADRMSGTLTLHNANWKADYLANPIEISEATVRLDNREVRWDPAAFSYGALKGTASLTVPFACDESQGCTPDFEVRFGALDAIALEAAILGVHEPGSLFSGLMARLSPSRAPAWPRLDGTVTADSLSLGPIKLERPAATLRILGSNAEISSFDAGVLGGDVHGAGTIEAAQAGGNGSGKPAYTFDGQFQHLSPQAVGKLVGMRWSGGELTGNGKVELSGLTGTEIAATANGALHFEWKHGSVGSNGSGGSGGTENDSAAPSSATGQLVPPALLRFDSWTADAEIANGAITLKQTEVQRGARRSAVAATVKIADPATVLFSPEKPAELTRR